MEALLFMFDVVCVTYLCWRVFRINPDRPESVDLGYFAYRQDDQAPVTDSKRRGHPDA